MRYEDEVTVRTWIERVGTKSITLRQQIVCVGPGSGDAPETVCTSSESVLVCFNLATQSAIEVPAAWRERIENGEL